MPGLTIGDPLPNLQVDITHGKLQLHDYVGNGYAIIFSHPVITHIAATVSPRANISSLPKVDESVLGQATSQLNRKLKDLNITSQKPVIFSDHVQVPEAFRNSLNFSTLDGSFSQEIASSKDANIVDRTTLATKDGASEPSLGSFSKVDSLVTLKMLQLLWIHSS